MADPSLAPARNARALVASAKKVHLQEAGARKQIGQRQDWQAEAWAYFREVPEVSFGAMWLANAMSKVALFAGWQLEDGTVVPVNHEKATDVPQGLATAALAEMARLRDEVGGQARINYLATLNLEVVGEFFLHGRMAQPEAGVPGTEGYRPAEPEVWAVRSTSQIAPTRNQDQLGRTVFVLKETPGDDKGRPIDNDTETVIRVWQEDPEWSDLAYCHFRPCLSDAELLMLLLNQQKAEAKSRQAPGILLVPSELSFAEDGSDVEGGDSQDQPEQNPFIAALMDALTEPIKDPQSAASVMPLVISGPAEYLKPDVFRLLSFARTTDATLDARIEARINRLARGLNVPVEVVMGHMSTTFSNAEQIDEDAYSDHVEPRATMLADGVRYGFLIPNLIAAGYDPMVLERLRVGVEAGALTPSQTAEENADSLFQAGAISLAAYRRLKGSTEEDAPNDEEAMLQLALRKGIFTADLTLALLQKAGIDLGVSINAESSQAVVVDDSAPAPAEDPPAEEPDPPADDEAVTAAGTRNVSRETFGRRLAEVDRDLRARLQGAVELTMDRALERAGNRVRAKVQDPALRAAAREVAPHRVCEHIGRRHGPEVLTAAGFQTSELLDGAWESFGSEFKLWGRQAGDQALDVVSEHLSGFTKAQRESMKLRQLESIDEAWAWLQQALSDVGAEILFNTDRGAVSAIANDLGEWATDARVPPGIIRQALALAGGARGLGGEPGILRPANLYPVGGVATGEIVMDGITEAGGQVEAFRWVYGPGRRSRFDPHHALDGAVFQNLDDSALVNRTGWPKFPHFYPGDHRGCLCDFEPIVVDLAAAKAMGLSIPTAVAEPAVEPVKVPPLPKYGAFKETTKVDGNWSAKKVAERTRAKLDAAPMDQREAHFGYTRGAHYDMNGALRGDPNIDMTDALADQIRSMDDLMESTAFSFSRPTTLYRGVSRLEMEAIRAYRPGQSFVLDGYTSTSLSPETALQFADEIGERVVRIEVPAMKARFLGGHPTEHEVILGRAGEFEVAAVDDSGVLLRWKANHVRND